MGQYFLIVNTDKKQFLDPYRFGEGVADLQVVSGYHAQALALLVVKMDDIYGSENGLMSSWSGDFVAAAGDYAQPDKHGIETSTPENSDRNLYKMAREEFEDVSYKALAMLCETREPVCYELAEKAALPRHKRLVFHLGNVIKEVGCEPLENAMYESLGSNWNKQYELLSKEHAE